MNREEARLDVVRAIRAAEAKVREAIAGGRLRGTANLGTKAAPWYGVRVAPGKRRLPVGRSVLTIAHDGELVAASFDGGAVTSRPVVDDELVIEDLRPVTQAYAEALDRHAFLLRRRDREFLLASRLANRLLAVLSEE